MRTWETIPTLQEVLRLHPDVEGFLFDMDGTIFNSEPLHAQAVREALIELNPDYEFPSAKKLDHMYRGTFDSFVFEDTMKRGWIPETATLDKFLERKNQILLSLDTRNDDFFSPRMKMFLNEIVSSEFSIGLVTNSERVVTYEHLGQHSLKNLFEVIITRESTETPKPHPAPYLLGCKSIGVAPGKTVVFEDSEAGYQSAKDAGTLVQKVTWYE
jgi:beta-phosphoglucomutase-like phosphatase (HAD superfamily)